MNIISKAEARKLHHPQAGTIINKFDKGKYMWKGSSKYYIGKSVPTLPCVIAVYPERRTDATGAYCQLMCVSLK